MKHMKILGLAAIVAIALMAFAGTASATVLCKEAITSGCAAAGKAYPAGAFIKRSLEGSSITESGETTFDTCTGSQFTSEIKSGGSSSTTVSGPNTTVDFDNCANEVHTISLGSLEIHHIAGTDNGVVTTSGVVVGKTLFGTNCRYESGTGLHLGTLTGSHNATLHVNAIVKGVTGNSFICPSTPTWTATFRVTSPVPLYVSAS
jgi:hypothetical protein